MPAHDEIADMQARYAELLTRMSTEQRAAFDVLVAPLVSQLGSSPEAWRGAMLTMGPLAAMGTTMGERAALFTAWLTGMLLEYPAGQVALRAIKGAFADPYPG